MANINNPANALYVNDSTGQSVAVSTSNPMPVGNSTPAVSYNSVTTNTFSYAPTADKQLIYAHVVYTADATVGNREIVLELVNPSSQVVGDWHTSAYITANQSGYHVEFLPGTYRETTFDAAHTIQTPFAAGLMIPSGYTLKVLDANNVSAADTMIVSIQVK